MEKRNHEVTPAAPLWPMLVLMGTAAMIAGGWLALHFGDQARAAAPPTLAATVLTEPRPLQAFALDGDDAEPFTRASLDGHWSFLTFGYTACPDVCPTTLAVLDQVARQLDDAGAAAPEVVFVSVDPERDSVQQLHRYVTHFNPQFHAATGPQSALEALTRQLGVLYMKVPAAGERSGYQIDHSASVLLVDPSGRLRAVFSPPHQAATIAVDFARIRDTYER